VRASPVPWTIVRGTQFHPFMAAMLRRLAFGSVGIAPTGFRSQPVDVGEFADALWRAVDDQPAGLTSEVGGPEVLTWAAMLRAWLAAQGRSPARARAARARSRGGRAAAWRGDGAGARGRAHHVGGMARAQPASPG
jgi:dTDP-4-dehydrorhamnose reductase